MSHIAAVEHRLPAEGELQTVVLVDGRTFISWTPVSEVNNLMDAFERQARLGYRDRTDRLQQMLLRANIARRLRADQAEEEFLAYIAAGCLWLTLRHYSNSADLNIGLQQQIKETGNAILTISVGTSAQAMDGTAWAFTIGSRTHDMRGQLAESPPETIDVIRRHA